MIDYSNLYNIIEYDLLEEFQVSSPIRVYIAVYNLNMRYKKLFEINYGVDNQTAEYFKILGRTLLKFRIERLEQYIQELKEDNIITTEGNNCTIEHLNIIYH